MIFSQDIHLLNSVITQAQYVQIHPIILCNIWAIDNKIQLRKLIHF